MRNACDQENAQIPVYYKTDSDYESTECKHAADHLLDSEQRIGRLAVHSRVVNTAKAKTYPLQAYQYETVSACSSRRYHIEVRIRKHGWTADSEGGCKV